MVNDNIKAIGNLEVKLLNSNGQEIDKRVLKNTVVHVGKGYITDRMKQNTAPIMSHMCIGNGNVVATTSQTLLSGEKARVTLDSSTVTNNTITYVATFGAGVPVGGATVAEAAVFNNDTANTGTMLCRVRFNEVNKGNSDIIVITWNVTIQ
jgi:hypothetical protein